MGVGGLCVCDVFQQSNNLFKKKNLIGFLSDITIIIFLQVWSYNLKQKSIILQKTI